MGLGLHSIDFTGAAENDPTQARPQKNDLLVFAFGDREGEIIASHDLSLGERPVTGYPMDPGSRLVRNGSRLNQVVLVRLDPDELAEETRAHSAEGIVAYSAVCTHTGCDVSEWVAETRSFGCSCHYSEFDPSNGARVLIGPAPRRLAALPLKLEDGVLKAAAGFSGRVGFKKG